MRKTCIRINTSNTKMPLFCFTFKVSIIEEDEGGFFVHYALLMHNFFNRVKMLRGKKRFNVENKLIISPFIHENVFQYYSLHLTFSQRT